MDRVCLNTLRSEGRGRDEVRVYSETFLLITHHAMSRTAQRFGMRTPEHMFTAVRAIWNGVVRFINDKGRDEAMEVPPPGWRVPIKAKGGGFVVLRRHETRHALIATTVIDSKP